MATFTFDNRQPRTVKVAVEPWAQALVLESMCRIVIEYDEPANLEVTLDDEGWVVICVSTRRIHITVPGFEVTFG